MIRLVIVLLFYVPCNLCGQSNSSGIRGRITDDFGTPLLGTVVLVKDTDIGVVANEEGYYEIMANIEGDYVVEFSFLGFETVYQSITFSLGVVRTLDIIMEEDVTALDEVSVVAKSMIRLKREEAYAINVIDAKELYNLGSDVNQVLNRTAGVRIRENGGLGSDFTFAINGFSGKQVKFFMDGIPIDNFGSSLTLNNFPVNLAESIEIYKGVLPIHLGSDALGGAVNIITRKASNYLDASYGFGSFNTHRANINGAYTHTNSGFTFRVTAFYNYSDNNYNVHVEPIDLESGQRLEEQEVERFHDDYESVTAHVEIGVVEKKYADRLLIGLIASGNEKDLQTGVTMDQVFGARTSSSSAIIPTLKYKKENLFVEDLDLQLYAAYNFSKNEFIDTTRARFNWLQESVATSSAEFFRTQQENKDKEMLTTTNLSYSLNLHHGLSLNHLYTNFSRESSDVENPDNITFLFPQSLRKHIFGFAYQAKYERFSGTAFAKAYLLKAESFEDVTDGSGGTNFQETNTNTQDFGYGTAVSYFIQPRLQAKASYERTYRLPEATELLGDGLFTRRNSDLISESSDNLNLGAKYELKFNDDNVIAIEGTYLHRKARDFIQLDQALSQPVDRQFVNLGDVTTNGLEVDVQLRYKKQLQVRWNLTYQEIIDKEEFLTSTNFQGTTTSPNFNFDFRIPNIPYLYGNFNMDYSFFKPSESKNQFNLGYALNYVEEYFFTPKQLGANNENNIPRQ
ncbi:MAG: TonB-dependent receptor, partial [Bacteroidota bacterium]